MQYNGNEYFYITNMQGDVIELVDINGNTAATYRYDAWGNIIDQTGGTIADINPYRYRGYRYDVATGYYYLQSRYYDPTIGRFISRDGLLGETGNLLTHNMYAYANNNPVMNVDPSGYSWKDIIEFVKNIGDKIVEYVDDVTPNTISVGGSLTAYLPAFTALGLGGSIGGGVSFQISLDKKGNLGLQYSVIGGVGTPSFSAALYKTTTNLPTIYDLNGFGASQGISFGEGYFVGVEISQYFADQLYMGSTTMYGFGARLPVPGEVHASGSITTTPWSFNINELFKDMFCRR